MQMTQTIRTPDRYSPSSLGQIVLNCWDFARSRYADDLELFDDVNKKKVTPPEYFNYVDWGWYVKRDNLPFDLNIKGIFLRNDGILRLEMTGLDFPRLAEQIPQTCYLHDVELRGRSFFYAGERIIKTTSRNIVRDGPPMFRTLVATMQRLPVLEDPEPIAAIVDTIYNYNCFRADSIPQPPASLSGPIGSMSQSMRLEQRMSMVRMMLQEQRMVMGQMPGDQKRLARAVLQLDPDSLQQILNDVGMTMEQVDRAIGSTLWVWAVRRIQRVRSELSFDQAKEVLRKMTRSKTR